MKKLLFAATALAGAAVLTGPALAADNIKLGLRGYFTGGVAYGSVDEPSRLGLGGNINSLNDVEESGFEEVLFGSDSEIHFQGKTTLDNGLQIGFRAELELERDSGEDQNDNEDDIVDEVYLQIDGGFGRVQFGQQDGVADQMILSAPNVFSEVTISSIDMDPFETQYDFISNNVNDGTQRNMIDTAPDFTEDMTKLIYFTPRIAGLQVGVSYTPIFGKNGQGFNFNDGPGPNAAPFNILDDNFGNNYFEIAANYVQQVGPVEVGVSTSYGTGEGGGAANDPEEWHVGTRLRAGGLTVGAAYKQASVSGVSGVQDTEVIDAGVTYETGPWTFGVAYGDSDGMRDDEEAFFKDDNLDQTAIIAGVAYKFGPGMEVGFGGMGFRDESTKIDRTNGDVLARGEQIDGFAGFTEISINF